MTERGDLRSDERLLRAVAQGDAVALTELYRRYAGRSLTLARRHALPDPVQVVEEAFMVLSRAAPGFGRSALPADVWTLGVIYRHCLTLAPGAVQAAPTRRSAAEPDAR